MSGGHLCETEAPTEPTEKTADPYSCYHYIIVGEGLCALPYIIKKQNMIRGFFR